MSGTVSTSAMKERQALMYQQVLRETASQYMNSGIVDGVIASMKIREESGENNYNVTPT
jgi:hypothetical protein